MQRLWSMGRLWDVLATLAILAAVWKLFLAPRFLPLAGAYPAPPATFARLDGPAFRVREARGRLLILDFYASWCAPCRIETPMVAAWARAHPAARVIPVDVGEPRAVVQAYAQAHRLGNVAYDPHAQARVMFGVVGFPTVVVIDPQGRVRSSWAGLNPAIDLALDHAAAVLGAPGASR